MNCKNFFASVGANSLSVVGTALQTNETLQTISLVITIIGVIVSMIVIPLVQWYIKAKKDGKITAEEISEAVEIGQTGINAVQEAIPDKKKGE